MISQKQTKKSTKFHSDIGFDTEINHLSYDQTSLSPTFELLETVSLYLPYPPDIQTFKV